MSLTILYNQLGGIISDIFIWFVNVVMNIITGIYAWTGVILYSAFILPLYIVVDGIFIVFKKFAGLDTYSYNGEYMQGDIVLSLINDPIVQNVFWSLLILGIILLIISTIIAVIKSEMAPFEEKSKNTKSRIVVKSLKALVNMFMVPVVAVLGVFVGNAVLKSLDQATNGSGESVMISGMVFRAAAYNCNRARSHEKFANDMIDNGLNTFGIIQGSTQEEIANSVDDAFATNAVINWQSLDQAITNIFSSDGSVYIYTIFLSIQSYGSLYLPRYSMSVYDSVFVCYYYDLLTYNYLIGIIVLSFCSYVLLATAIGLIKRLFKLTMLLIISPPVVAISPIDDGKALGKWRQSFIGTTLSAYGTVVGLNIFILLLTPLQKINFFPVNVGQEDLNIILSGLTGALLNPLVLLLILVAGLLFFKDMPKTIASLIGAEDAFEDGAKATAEIAKKVGSAVAMASGVGGAAMAAAKKAGAKKLANMAKNKLTQKGGINDKIANLEKKKADGTLTDDETKELDSLNKERDNLLQEEKEQTEKANAYDDMAKARLNQAKNKGLSLVPGGLADTFRKELSDSGVDKAKKGDKDHIGTNGIEKREKRRKKLLKKDETYRKMNDNIDDLQDEYKEKKKDVKKKLKDPLLSHHDRATLIVERDDMKEDIDKAIAERDDYAKVTGRRLEKEAADNEMPEYERVEKAKKKAGEKEEKDRRERAEEASISTASLLNDLRSDIKTSSSKGLKKEDIKEIIREELDLQTEKIKKNNDPKK